MRGGYRGGTDGVVAVHQAAHAVAAPWEHRRVAIVVILASDGTVIQRRSKTNPCECHALVLAPGAGGSLVHMPSPQRLDVGHPLLGLPHVLLLVHVVQKRIFGGPTYPTIVRGRRCDLLRFPRVFAGLHHRENALSVCDGAASPSVRQLAENCSHREGVGAVDVALQRQPSALTWGRLVNVAVRTGCKPRSHCHSGEVCVRTKTQQPSRPRTPLLQSMYYIMNTL